MKTLGVFLPVCNEEENLDELFYELDGLKKQLLKKKVQLILLVHDNYSTDNSWNIIKKHICRFPESTAIKLSVNIGYQPSLTMSFSHTHTDAYVIYQSDRQDPIEIIIQMCESWLQGSNCIVAVATDRAGKITERFGRLVFINLFRSSSDIKNFNWFTDYYLLDKSLYAQFVGLPLLNQFIRGRIMDSFPIQTTIGYSRSERKKGKSKFNFAKKYSLALDAILLHASRFIRFLTLFGSLASCSLIAALTFTTITRLLTTSSNSLFFTLKSAFVPLLMSLILLLISLILEYLRRIYSMSLSTRDITNSQYSGLIAEVLTVNKKNVGVLLKP